MRELLIGCGSRRVKQVEVNGRVGWDDLTTLDADPSCGPDVRWDLTEFPFPFAGDSFDEIHAYDVLEHTGSQGDYRFFFAQFSDFWRLLKPNGLFCAIVPSLTSPWAWGDPSHTRCLPPTCLMYLDQAAYAENIGKSPMSDFRGIYRGDFTTEFTKLDELNFVFVLRAVKPSRWVSPQN